MKRSYGKRYFRGLGRQAAALGLPLLGGTSRRGAWPSWAQQAFRDGYEEHRGLETRQRLNALMRRQS